MSAYSSSEEWSQACSFDRDMEKSPSSSDLTLLDSFTITLADFQDPNTDKEDAMTAFLGTVLHRFMTEIY